MRITVFIGTVIRVFDAFVCVRGPVVGVEYKITRLLPRGGFGDYGNRLAEAALLGQADHREGVAEKFFKVGFGFLGAVIRGGSGKIQAFCGFCGVESDAHINIPAVLGQAVGFENKRYIVCFPCHRLQGVQRYVAYISHLPDYPS